MSAAPRGAGGAGTPDGSGTGAGGSAPDPVNPSGAGTPGGAGTAGASGGATAAGGVRRLTDADARRGRRGVPAASGDGAPVSRPWPQNLAIVAGAFAGGTLVAELAGATNLGTALSFGQIAFAIALVFVLVRR